LEEWLTIGGSVFVVLAGAFIFYRYRMHQKDVTSETQLTEMNQSLIQADEQLQSANNPLEQSQFNIPSHDLHLQKRIGAGGNGWIYRASLGAHTLVAAKEIMSTTIDPRDMVEFEHEAKMLTQMNHPQVLRVFGFCSKPAKENEDNQERRYIITEFAPNGSLEQVIVKAARIVATKIATKMDSLKLPFTKLQALEWAVQIASGMAFLHRKGYVHRDMKPQNVLLNKSNDALVADLGTVRRPPSGLYPSDKVQPTAGGEEKHNPIGAFLDDIDEEQGCINTLSTLHGMTAMKGTPLYMAPEQFQSSDYSYPVDVWAYGLTLVRLFTLKWPYPLETGFRRLVNEIGQGTLKPVQVELHEVPHQDVLSVINDCLHFQESKRPTMKEVEKRLTDAYQKLVREEEMKTKKERRRIMDIKKERRIQRREKERERKSKEKTSLKNERKNQKRKK